MLSGELNTNKISPEERVMVQGLMNETYKKFKGEVAAGRNAAERNQKDGCLVVLDWTNYADGLVLSGTQAYQHGFVDEIGHFQGAVDCGSIRRHPDEFNRIPRTYDFSSFFHLLGQSDRTHTIKVDFGMDLPKLQAGELFPFTHLHRLIERSPAHRRGQRARREYALRRRARRCPIRSSIYTPAGAR